jgi:hypothetical protein
MGGTLRKLVKAMGAKPREYAHSAYVHCVKSGETKHSAIQRPMGGTPGKLVKAMGAKPKEYEHSAYVQCVRC